MITAAESPAAANINERLEQLGFRNIGVIERPNLVVLNSTDIPALLVEAGFINNSEDNRLFDQQFDAIARAIAKGIEDAYPAVKPEVYYRVQTGMFRNRDNAERMLYRLQADGFPVFLTYRDGLFRVQVGCFPGTGKCPCRWSSGSDGRAMRRGS